MIKRFIRKYFDYEITGEYYDNDDKGHYQQKYHKRYYLKFFRKLKKRRGGHK